MIPLVCRYRKLEFEELEPFTHHGLIIYAVRIVLVLEFHCSQTETVPNHHGHLKICY